MIIQTRYRDVPKEEVAQAHRGMPPALDRERWENLMRGRPIKILVPQIPPEELNPEQRLCGSPWYRVVDGPVEEADACCHLAEIGD